VTEIHLTEVLNGASRHDGGSDPADRMSCQDDSYKVGDSVEA
jgi:hypothetical protein